MSTKVCARCAVEKPLTAFYDRANSKDGKRSRCIECHIKVSNLSKKKRSPLDLKEDWLRETYSLSMVDYNKMLVKQEGKCLICSVSQLDLDYSFAVDHCHDSGQIRGLLCTNCNQGLGNFKDNVSFLTNAINYLNNSRTKDTN